MKLRINKDQRVGIAKKSEKTPVGTGVPRLDDLFEGSKSIRLTKDGLSEYIKYKNVLYKLVYIREQDPNVITNFATQDAITTLTEATGQTASNSIANTAGVTPTTAEFEIAVASIVSKIEAILRVLRTHKLIKE